MKRVFLTGEKGFIAKNLIKMAENRLDFISFKPNMFTGNHKGEMSFTDPVGIYAIKKVLEEQKCDVIIHNGATVGTDVCGLYPKEAIINNVYGTFNIATIAKELNIPVVYIGTTVIYDTQEYQNDWIDENSLIFPRTLYATTKYEGELIIKAYCQKSKYCILRPLFCYGGEGDMNSLIAKTIFNDVSGRKKPFKIFLNPTKTKDYMHVNDFCEAIVLAATNSYILNFNTDFNISADNPIKTHDIVDKINRHANVDVNYIEWVPETDYLGNHIIDNMKFKIATSKVGRWLPKIELVEGIEMVNNDLREIFKKYLYEDRHYRYPYDPFRYLDEIEQKNIDIKTHYNFKE